MKTIKNKFEFLKQDYLICFIYILFNCLNLLANSNSKKTLSNELQFTQVARISNYIQFAFSDEKEITFGDKHIVYSTSKYNLVVLNDKNSKFFVLEYKKNNIINYIILNNKINTKIFQVAFLSKDNLQLNYEVTNPSCSKKISSTDITKLLNPNIFDVISQIKMGSLFNLDSCKSFPEKDLKKVYELASNQLNLKYAFLSDCLENTNVKKRIDMDPMLSIAFSTYLSNFIQLVNSINQSKPKLKINCEIKSNGTKVASVQKASMPNKLVLYGNTNGLLICNSKNPEAILDHEIFHYGAMIPPLTLNSSCLDESYTKYFEKLCDPRVNFAKLETSSDFMKSCSVKSIQTKIVARKADGLAGVATKTFHQADKEKKDINASNAAALARNLNHGTSGKALIGQLTAVPGSKEVTAALAGVRMPKSGEAITVPRGSLAPVAAVGSRLEKLGDTLLAAAATTEQSGSGSIATTGSKTMATFMPMGLSGIQEAFFGSGVTSTNSDEPSETSPKLDSPRLASRSNGSSSNSGSGPSSGLVSDGRGPASVSIKSVVVGDAGLPNSDTQSPSDSPSQHDVVVVPTPILANAKSPSAAQAQPSNPAQVAKGINTPASANAKPSAVASNSANVDNRIATGGVVSPNDSSSTGGAINGGSSKGIVQKAKAKPSNVATESGPVKPSRGIASIANGTGQFTSSNLQNSNPINGNDTSKAIKAFSMAKVIKGETYTKLRTTLLEPDNLIKSPSQAQLKQQLKKQLVQQGIFIYNAESQKAIVGDIQKASRCFKDSTVDKQFIKMECSDIKLMK